MSRKLINRMKSAVPLIAHRNPKLPITEQYRLIRTNIQFSSVDKNMKTIVITSPEPSDGKSTTAANLAIVLAQQGKPVLLVDADLRKPTVHFAFNASNINGLTSILAKRISFDDAIVKTFVPNLSILTSGTIPPNPSELLASNAMETLVDELTPMFEYIIFDTPPILAVADAQIIANKCDGAVMVVASGKTQKDRAIKAKELLEKAKAKLLGVVINGVESKKKDYYHQYQ